MKKRIISALLVAAMLAASLVGCASTPPKDTDTKSTATTTSTGSKSDSESTSSTSDSVADPEETEPEENIVLRTTFSQGEIYPEQIALYTSEHPNVTVEYVAADDTKLMSMIAAGTGPDILRIYAVQALPSYVTRGIIGSVQKYLDAGLGEFIAEQGDFLPIEDNCRWDSEKNIQGSGEIYGFVKDFSNDQALIINKKMFTDAGLEIPDPKTPLTYTELGEICKKIQVMDGATPKTYGMSFWDGDLASYMRLLVYNSQVGESPWSDDFASADFSNKASMDYLTWAVDLIKTGSSVCSIVMQPPNGDQLGAFVSGDVAIASTGYWYSGALRSNEKTKDNLDNYIYLPTPQAEGTEFTSYCAAATSLVMLRATKYPEETYKFIDYFIGGPPAMDRAKSGWGIPVFESLFDLLPNSTNFDINAKEVAMTEASAMTKTLQVNPFIAPATMTNLLAKYLPPVYTGDETLENAVASINTELQPLIAEGMEVAGMKK